MDDHLDMPSVEDIVDEGIDRNDVTGTSSHGRTAPTEVGGSASTELGGTVRTEVGRSSPTVGNHEPEGETTPSEICGEGLRSTLARNVLFSTGETLRTTSVRRPLVNRRCLEDRRPSEPSSTTSQIMEVLKVQLAQDQHKA